ncbi:MAG: hypothetical protein JEY71_00215 [Sphaerochaeta sp.]|nr:hypothetical protein [Sphaerochaeta sp.]
MKGINTPGQALERGGVASSEDHLYVALFGRPLTLVLTTLTLVTLLSNIDGVKRMFRFLLGQKSA